MHRRAAALFLALSVAACAAPKPEVVEISLRNPTAPYGGTSRFEAGRFAGDWQTIACIGTCAEKVRYVVAPGEGLVRQVGEGKTAYVVPSPGVLREQEGDGTLVVMWVDEGFRTAVIGDAEGRWAAILDRGQGSADRTRAAHEILDFNGWDVSQLQDVK